MKKYILSFGILAAAVLSMTSCLSSSTSDQKYTFSYGNSDCFNRVVDVETGEEFIFQNPMYSFVYNTSKMTVDIDMSNIRIGDGFSGLSFKLAGLTFQNNNKTGFLETSARDIVPYGAAQSFIFNSLSLNSLPWRSIGSNSIPAFNLSYLINNRYRVTVIPTQSVFIGTTVANNLSSDADDPTYTVANDPSSFYVIQIDPAKMIAKLLVYGAQFSSDMTAYNFAVTNIPAKITTNGFEIKSDADQVLNLYDSSNKVIEGQTLSNLYINVNLASGAVINFNCDLGETGKYFVNASLQYLIYNNVEE